MAKLARDQKMEIYHKRKSGVTISSLSKQYGVLGSNVHHLVRLIDIHGEDILRNDKNKYYSPELKPGMINKVLIGNQTMESVSLEYGLTSHGMLHNWIRSYKDNGYTIVEKKRGRSPL